MLTITAVTAAEPLDLVAEMAGDFAASHDVHATLAHGLRRIADWVGAEAASLFLVDEAAGGLVCSACLGPVDITGLSVPMGGGIVGRTVAEDRARMVRDAARDPDFHGTVDRDT
ncbi:MAG: serine/threonine protein phosphatase, partial [Alphaproteobacteria bacterium]|nr:serine/threonine protein phosphatase [Alphaproteobacteria bacterium]